MIRPDTEETGGSSETVPVQDWPTLLRQVSTGECSARAIEPQLRQAWLVLARENTAKGGHLLHPLTARGTGWLPVFTSLDEWAAFFAAVGRGDEPLGYGWLPGSELFDQVLPQLPIGTGLVLDPASEYALALPGNPEREGRRS